MKSPAHAPDSNHSKTNKPNPAAPFFKPFIQTKLTVNEPGDHYEREADATADRVMRMTDTSINPTGFFKPASGTIQRKCQACEEEDKHVHRKESNGAEVHGNRALGNYISSLSSTGQSMPDSSRKFFEPRFGHDFSNVRLHTDSVAAKSAQSINALAYTSGNNIVFNSGQYSPESDSGKRLMAHELTHVVQQNSGVSPKLIQRALTVNPTDSVPLAPGVAGPPTPLTAAIQGLIDQTCPTGGFRVDPTTGVVSSQERFCKQHPPLAPGVAEADISPTPVGCRCLCDVISHPRNTTIRYHRGGPFVDPANMHDATTGTGSNATANFDPNFQGQYNINGVWTDVPFFLLFSHEICGHALPVMAGTQVAPGRGPAGGTPPHERYSVDTERRIAAEHNLPRRPEDYGGAARERP
jgi:hypothetical protein